MATPFFTSQTPIARMDTRLAGSIGDRYAQGIQQGVGAFLQGVQQYQAKREEKKQEESAMLFLKGMQKEFPELNKLSDDQLKAGMKGMGGPRGVLDFAVNLKGMREEAEHKKVLQERYAAEIKAINDETARKERSDNAIRNAFDPTSKAKEQIRGGAEFGNIDFSAPTPEESTLMALRQGADPRDLSQVAGLFASSTVSPRLEMVDGRIPVVVAGKQAMIDPAYSAAQSAERGFKPHEVEILLKKREEAVANNDVLAAEYYTKALEKAVSKSGNDWEALLGGNGTPKPEGGEEVVTGPPPKPKGLPEGFKWNESKRRWEKR